MVLVLARWPLHVGQCALSARGDSALLAQMHARIAANDVLVERDAQARPVGDGEVAVYGPSVQWLFHEFHDGGFAVGPPLLDDEIRDAGIELHRSRRADGAGAVMGLHVQIVRLGAGGDLFYFGQAAGQSQVRLEDIHGLRLDVLAKAIARVEALSGGDGDGDVLRHP